jgi:aspartate/methionine/tyrosine aminotransferase
LHFVLAATPRYVRLERNHTPGKTKTADDFKLDLDALRATINEKTRLIVLNTPQNPTGKVFSLKELEELADIVKVRLSLHSLL